MFSESSGSFCFMGVSSNAAVFVSDKDLKGNVDPTKYGLLVRPSMEFKEECQTSSPEDHREVITPKPPSVQAREEEEADHEEGQTQRNVIVSSVPVTPLRKLKLEIPSYEGTAEDDSKDGLKTPTSSDHKILILECPGAPRKTKPRPIKKRKACDGMQQIVPADLCQELESLFPTPVVVDHGAGGKIKRVKQRPTG